MIKTRGLTHIHLAVGDLRRSLRFYRQVFGMEERFWSGPTMVFLSTPGAQDLVTLRQAGTDEPVGDSGGIAHFGFGLQAGENLDAAINAVMDGGGALIERGEHAPGVPFAYIKDPDGYVIEL